MDWHLQNHSFQRTWTSSPDLTDAQQTALDPTANVWVTASAGSGKTKVLTDRVLNLLLSGSSPQRILCLTFTKAAAVEMSQRLYKRLRDWSLMDENVLAKEIRPFQGTVERARGLYKVLLEEGLKIQTIHAFAQSLLRQFPLEAGLRPHFEVIDESGAKSIWIQAQDEAFKHNQESLSTLLPYWGITDLLAMIEESLARPELLEDLFQGKISPIDVGDILSGLLAIRPQDSPKKLWDVFVQEEPWDLLISIIKDLAYGTAVDQSRAHVLKQWVNHHNALTFQAYRSFFLTEKGNQRQNLTSVAWARQYPQHITVLRHQQKRIMMWWMQDKSIRLLQQTQAFLDVLCAAHKNYTQKKSQAGVLDYADLISRSFALLESDQFPWVLYKLDGGLDHVLLDEAQDTSRGQWRLIAALVQEFFSSRKPIKTLFVVGDPKQSIYSFQGADTQCFETMKTFFKNQVLNHQARWFEVALNISFRSVPVILKAVDTAFQSPYLRSGVVSEGQALCHIPCKNKEKMPGFVDLWPLEISSVKTSCQDIKDDPSLKELGGSTAMSKLAQKISGEVEDLIVNSKFRPQDIMILVRRRSSFLDILTQIFKEKKIPVSGLDRLTVKEQLVIQDLVAWGQAILLPEDDLNLAAVLKGPFFSVSEDQLFEWAAHRGNASLWEEVCRRAPEIAESLRENFILVHRPFFLYHHWLYGKGYLKKLLLQLGPGAQGPIEAFLELARIYEAEHIPSLQGFLSWVLEKDSLPYSDRAIMAREEVRLMTIHGAKGLQAPVVFVTDMVQVPREPVGLLFSRQGIPVLAPSQDGDVDWTRDLKKQVRQDQIDEYHRLFYVAMTRAEERLYLCGFHNTGQFSHESWYGALQEHCQGWKEDQVDCDLPRRVDKDNRSFTEDVSLPLWVKAQPMVERNMETLFPAMKANVQTSALKDGERMHSLLNALVCLEPDERVAQALLLEPSLPAEKRNQVLQVLCNPDLSFLWQSQREVPIQGIVNDSLISGRIDCLVVRDQQIQIIDFKTNQNPPHHIPQNYRHQLDLYRKLVEPLYPGSCIQCGILWLSSGILQWL